MGILQPICRQRLYGPVHSLIMEGRGEPMPLWVKPAKPLCSQRPQGYDARPLRRHPPGHEQRYRRGPLRLPHTAGDPWNTSSTARPTPTNAPLPPSKTGFSFVADMNNDRHDAMKGILWFGVDDANTCVYVPVFCANTTVPKSLDEKTADLLTPRGIRCSGSTIMLQTRHTTAIAR